MGLTSRSRAQYEETMSPAPGDMIKRGVDVLGGRAGPEIEAKMECESMETRADFVGAVSQEELF